MIGDRRALVLSIVKQLDDLKKLGDVAGMRKMINEQFQPAIAGYVGALDGFVKAQDTRAICAKEQAQAQAHRAEMTTR